jgi:error-prone DNA polymerase
VVPSTLKRKPRAAGVAGDPRSLPKGPKPRDIYDPYGDIDQIRVKTRDFR